MGSEEEGVYHVAPEGHKVFNYKVIDACNNNCIHCICRKDYQSPEIELSDIIGKIESLDKDTKDIYICGGEPTIKKDLFRILEEIGKRMSCKIHLLTNGRMFHYIDYARAFAHLGLDCEAAVPFHSCDPVIFDEITQVKGSFEQTAEGIRNLLSLGIPVEIRIVVTKKNHGSLEKTAKYIADNFGGVMKVVIIAVDMTGNARINHDDISIRLSDAKGYIEKAIDILSERDVPVRLNQFPFCVLAERYRTFAGNNTRVENEHVLSLKCEDCAMKDDCSGVWASYLKEYGDGELKPIETNVIVKKGRESTEKDYSSFRGSISDVIAVKKGIKPLAQLSCNSREEYGQMKKAAERMGLFLAADRHVIGQSKSKKYYPNDPRNGLLPFKGDVDGTLYLYLSKDEKLAKWAVMNNPETDSSWPKIPREKTRAFAEKLGYPGCCIDNFFQTADDRSSVKRLFFTELMNRQKDYRLNYFHKGNSDNYLSFHIPCSFTCRKSVKYNGSILDAISEEMPGFAEKIKSTLRMPLLLWFKPDMPLACNRDKGIGYFFDGQLTGEMLKYSRAYRLKDIYYHMNNEHEHAAPLIEESDCLNADNKEIRFMKGGNLIATIKKENALDGILVSF